MNGDLDIESLMREAVSPKSLDDWAVWEAANDPKILVGVEIIGDQEGRADPDTIEIFKKGLMAYSRDTYKDVPVERLDDVFLAAKSIIKEERIADGEA